MLFFSFLKSQSFPYSSQTFASPCMCVCVCVSAALLPTYSQQGLVVVDVFGGKRWTHADSKRWQRQSRQQASQQELQLDLLLVGGWWRSLTWNQGLTYR